MKRVVLALLLVVGSFVLWNTFGHSDYKEARNYAKNGDYEKFYSSIEKDFKNGDDDAKEAFTGILCHVIQKGDINTVDFLLSKDKSMINYQGANDNRPLTCAIANPYEINIPMLQKILSYYPDTNYEMKSWNNVTVLQAIALNKKLKNNTEVAKLLIEKGADVNRRSYNESKSSSMPALEIFGQITNNFDAFKLLLDNGAFVQYYQKGKQLDLLKQLGTSYLVYFGNHGAKPDKTILHREWTKEEIALLQSDGFKSFHLNNMRYINELDKHGMLAYSQDSKKGLGLLAIGFIIANDVSGIKMLLKNGLCNDGRESCRWIVEDARAVGNYEIASIIEKRN